MEIRIQKLKINNFKRIQSFEVIFNGRDYNIYGKNESGKTTILDAFTWCLFEKDSLGATKFSWKPLTKDGKERHNLETSVEVTLSVDGQEKVLKRTIQEVYTKKRGEADLTFTGHETTYTIDGIDRSAGDYKKVINDLIREDLFRMLTSVTYFTGLNWSQQREIIFSLVRNVTDRAIADDNPEYTELISYLAKGIQVTDIWKQKKLEKQNLNLQAKTLATQISTLKDTKFDLPDNFNPTETEENLKKAYARMQEIANLKASKASGSKQADLQMAIIDLRATIKQLEIDRQGKINQALAKHDAEVQDQAAKARKLSQELSWLSDDRDNLSLRIQQAEKIIADEKAKKDQLYKDYDKENSVVFSAGSCAYCGQPLPEDKLTEAKNKFNLEVAKKLEAIVEAGKKCNALITQTTSQIEALKTNLTEKLANIAQITSDLYTLQESIKAQKTPVIDTKEFDQEIDKQKDRLSTIEKTVDKQEATTDEFADEKLHLESEISRLNTLLANYKQKQQNESRVENFLADLAKANSESIENDRLQILCEKFLAEKAKYLEAKINDYFDIVKFQLFEVQINGGIVETCVATVDGVPYPSVNNAGRINAGLDIIKTLQMIYGVKAPIWIDNAESVNATLTVPSQTIKLFVTADDEVLRTEESQKYSDIIINKNETMGEKEIRA